MTPAAVAIYAAGSLRNALPLVSGAFTKNTGIAVTVRHGPAGLLREHIESGGRPDLFLSANMEHPVRLHQLGLAAPPILFARNRMVALVRRTAGITQDNFIGRSLEPAIRIGTSTPVNDPSGDYAWEIFRSIDAARAGALAILDAKAQKLVGGSVPTAALPPSYDIVASALAEGSVDMFLGYATGLVPLAHKLSDVEIVELPKEINVVPEYGLAVLKDALPSALSFALFLMSGAGQGLIRQAGFLPVALSADA
ncbi:substrate-binding domain-containing protein [Aestuariivirga sp. YIM B02566]|uniref:Substrate-binding domain-containing protein n=1 Tax=Taklimakanibacter albus TaxID=2800327 RepID=A0ACC5R075_9HYPH|nr:substrate-binding domain-containing protein [Aestuariivirga sp. YIM B02566]